MTRNALLFRLMVASAIVPILIGAIGVIIMLSWLPALPRQVIVHWGVDGNELGAPGYYPLVAGIVVVAISAVLSGFLARAVHPGAPSVYELLLAVVPIWISVFITGSAVVLLGAQRNGIAEMGHPYVGALASAGIAAAATGAALLLLPRPRPRAAGNEGTPATAIPLEAGQRAAWIGHVGITARVTVLVMVLAAALFAGGLALIFASRPFGWVMAVLAVIFAFGLSVFDIHVTIDRRGMLVRGVLGVPTMRIAIDDVERVSVTTVTGLVDTGGWGIRFVPGGRTVVMIRSGEAIEVLRKSGRTLVVTIDDAQGGASVLAALVAQPVK